MISKLSLNTVLTNISSAAEMKKFMRDLCTQTELKAMNERFEVVQLISQGITYREINRMTGVSTATITRVAHWLNHGEGGYRTVLGRQQRH